MFAAEARGLAWLGEAKALRVPARAGGVGADELTPFLALELVRSAPPRAPTSTSGWAAGWRRCTATARPASAWITTTSSAACPRRTRVAASPGPSSIGCGASSPQLRRPPTPGWRRRACAATSSACSRQLEALCGPAEPPARLHGDLWGGNLHRDDLGAPCLIDPAVYGGHREIDLAMMRLFGGFGPRVFAAYKEAFPLADGYRERVPLYQLYPLMVHVNLFGGGYVSQVEGTLARLV